MNASAESVARPSADRPRLLVVKLSSLGDVLHALPAVHALKLGLNAAIDWVTQTPYVDLVRCCPDVERVIVFDRRHAWRTLRPFLAELRAADYEWIVDLQGLLKSALVTRLARGARRIGPSFHREGARWFYTAVAGPRDKQRHAVEENLDVARYLGLPVPPPEFPLALPLRLLGEPPPRVALLPHSRWSSKNWPVASFVEVGRELQDHVGATLYLLGGAEEAAVCAQMEKELKGPVVNLAGQTTLVQLGGVLKEMNLVIANDSGPMHLAAAVGTPVLAIFGATDPRRTGPYGPRHRVVKGKLLCQPCFARACRYRDHSCMRAVTPQLVVPLAIEMLTGRPPAPGRRKTVTVVRETIAHPCLALS